MAAKKSAAYPYQWPDGSWHSVPKAAPATGPAKGVPYTPTLPPPPPGTYDPSLDYEKAASQRGYDQTADDTATQYQLQTEQAGLAGENLLTALNRSVADLGQQKTDVLHGYQVLGNQQGEAARQHGITSAGLLGLGADKRAANQAHDVAPIDTALTRANEDYKSQKTAQDLTNAYNYGGYNGNGLTDPITGQPVIGSMTTNLARAGVENQAYQGGLLGQMIYGAQQNGYVAPGAAPLTAAQIAQRQKTFAGAGGSSGGLPAHFTGSGWW